MDIKDKTNWVIGGAAVVLVAILGWWLFTKPAIPAVVETETGTEINTSTTPAATTGTQPAVEVATGEEVTVNDQPAGDSVQVVEAKLSRVSWLAVRDDMRIYGAAKVTPPVGGGTVQDITIPLLRNTETGKTYKVVVYADDGDNVFDFKKDPMVEGLDDMFSALNGD